MTKSQPLDNLTVSGQSHVPLLHICGSLDPADGSTAREAEKRYKELGGRITVIVQEGKGHYPTAPSDPKPAVDFILDSQKAHGAGDPSSK